MTDHQGIRTRFELDECIDLLLERVSRLEARVQELEDEPSYTEQERQRRRDLGYFE